MRTSGRVAGLTLVACVLGACSSGGHHAVAPTTTASTPSTRVTTTARGTAPATGTTAPSPGTAAFPARWTTYGGNVARTGLAADGPERGGALLERWTSPTLDGDVYAQPLVVGSSGHRRDRERHACTRWTSTNGAIVWKRHLGEPVAGVVAAVR